MLGNIEKIDGIIIKGIQINQISAWNKPEKVDKSLNEPKRLQIHWFKAHSSSYIGIRNSTLVALFGLSLYTNILGHV